MPTENDRTPRPSSDARPLRLLVALRVVSLLALLGCTASSPLGSAVSLPPDVAGNCQKLCSDAGLRMSSIVVMANAVGCVCEPTGASSSKGGVGAAAGVMTIAMQSQQSQHQNQQQSTNSNR